MKKYIKNLVIFIVCLVACVGLLGGCKGNYHCKPQKKPANLKPIDCKNFNDVTTTYWNLYCDCEHIAGNFEPPPCGTLLVEGWGYKNGDFIILCADSASAANHLSNVPLLWRAGTDAVDDYYYIVCTSVLYKEGKPGIYLIELIGERIYQETENKTGR